MIFASVIKKRVSESAVLSGGELWPVTAKTIKLKATNSIICGNNKKNRRNLTRNERLEGATGYLVISCTKCKIKGAEMAWTY